MKNENQTQAQKVQQFVQQVQESETQKAQDNKPMSAEEEDAERKAFFDSAWKDLPLTDRYFINLVNNMQEWARFAMSLISPQANQYIDAYREYLEEKNKKA